MSTLPSDQTPLQWLPIYPNPEIGVDSSFRDSINSNASYFEIPTNLACAYLKSHLIGRAKDWFEVIGSSYLTGTATDFAQLKQALTNSFPVVRNGSELEAVFNSSHQVGSQAPSDFVYKLLKIQKILNFETIEENLLNHIIMRLSPQVMDYVEVRNPTTKDQLLQLVDKCCGDRRIGQCRDKRMRSERSTESSNKHESQHQSKISPPVRRNWRNRSAPSSLMENTEVKRRPRGSCKWRKRPIPVSLPLGPGTRKMTRREAADEN
ncbi:uncharacterized protein NPIL_489861 [Nephila pilipes]|uniref:Retrotransposon gag domain-containing protein n=1 Tax=Nephila pilipes TaxID=299642 RepID=A0A8X6U2F6_NEPPI|nr:uncharacterized protein NPIL_489861 [Nephila pilipes]